MTDDELLARGVDSEASAFAELYERYLQPVQRYVRSRVADEATAEDLTAQIFVKTFESAESYRGEGSFRSWIFQIARNTISSWRRSKRRSEIPVEEIPEVSLVDDPLEVASGLDGDDIVLATIAELPRAQREVVTLRYWKDLTIDEIARVTRRSTGAVRQLLHRARNRVRRRLTTKDLSALAGATGASALALYSIKRHRNKKRTRTASARAGGEKKR